MNIYKIIKEKVRKKTSKLSNIERFRFDNRLDIKKDLREKYNYTGALLEFFAENENNAVHKWHHYIPLYEKYFSSFRGGKVRILEIGVSKGGSLQLWRKYFGDEAVIFGIDINPDCSRYNKIAAEVRIGSQADPEFLKAVVNEMGGCDIVLDDGSHQMDHINASLQCLFPLLSDGGIYMIEDLHCAYWKKWGGGYSSRNNFFARVRNIIDDMHHWYHDRAIKEPMISKYCSGIHIHDSLIVFEKKAVLYRPSHSQISR